MRENAGTFLFLISAALAIAILIARSLSNSLQLERATLKNARDEISKLKEEASEKRRELANTVLQKDKVIAQKQYLVDGLTHIIDERKSQFPWLATGFSDLKLLVAERAAAFLESKKHPAGKSAEMVREYGKKQKEAVRDLRLFRYRVEYYEKLFPWITDYVGDDVPDSAVDVSGANSNDDDDPAKAWLSQAEYDYLPTAAKYQKALDNWKRRRRTNWQVGRDYERYVGFVYETQGYDVIFSGAIEGLEDMGRDVIARREQELAVIQCKYWSSEKVIREKHIFQLYASALEYGYRLGGLTKSGPYSFTGSETAPRILPILYTSTKLSDVAREVAKILDVAVYEDVRIADYPIIKCNVSMRDGEKIYHLPFDQQYDRVKLKRKDERYVYSVSDAEALGFRRAWRWRPDA